MLAASILSVFSHAADPITESATEPLSHLVESVERLRGKDIPQAYFWLLSPQAPNSAIFFPDTRGGAFILIAQIMKLPKGTSAITAHAEISETLPESEVPILDAKSDRLLYYSDEDWIHLVKTLQPWVTEAEVVKGLAAANLWEIDQNDLIIKIPTKDTPKFYAALMRAWKTREEEFRCFAGWN